MMYIRLDARVNKYFQIDRNFTEIEKMLFLVRKYGFTHVCAYREYEIKLDPSIRNQASEAQWAPWRPYLNFPYLDFYIAPRRDIERVDIKYFYRGTLDEQKEAEFQNLFEYMLARSFAGTGFRNSYI